MAGERVVGIFEEHRRRVLSVLPDAEVCLSGSALAADVKADDVDLVALVTDVAGAAERLPTRSVAEAVASMASRHHLRTAIAHAYGRRVRSTRPQEAASVCPCHAHGEAVQALDRRESSAYRGRTSLRCPAEAKRR